MCVVSGWVIALGLPMTAWSSRGSAAGLGVLALLLVLEPLEGMS